jgi:metal-dependent amidase/aminoacylase/carboxypeptidase family protein
MNPEGLHKNETSKTPTVVAFGKIEGLGATNVIPEIVKCEGTFRTMDEEWRKKAHISMKKLASDIAKKHQATAELRIDIGYPFLSNNEAITENCIQLAKSYLGEDNVVELPLRMTAEDFAFVSQEVPSCFFRLGTANFQKGITSGVHTPTFDIDEASLEIGAGLLAYLAFNHLADNKA